jgi:uncharacterized alkaline shock family protein YloU
MKLLHGVLTGIVAAFIAVLGVALVWTGVTPELLTLPAGPLQVLVAGHSLRFLLGVYLLVVLALWMLSAVCPCGRERFLRFDGEAGEVRVGLDALREYLARAMTGVDQVVQVRPHVTLKGEHLTVDMVCRIEAGRPVPDVARRLQDHARARLAEVLGRPGDVTVRVTVRELRPSQEPPRPIEEISTLRPPQPGFYGESDSAEQRGSAT